MSDKEKFPDFGQSAVNGLQAGENITIGDIHQSVINSSSERYNHVGVIISEYKNKMAKLERTYKERSRSNQTTMYKELQNYHKSTIRQQIEACQERIGNLREEIKDLEKHCSDKNQSKEKDVTLLGLTILSAPQRLKICINLKISEEEKKEELKGDINELKYLISSVEGFLRLNSLELDIDQVIDSEALENLSSYTREGIERIKDDYETKQEELKEFYEQESEKYGKEKNIRIYKHDLRCLLDKDGYPLKSESLRLLTSRSQELQLDQEDIESIDNVLIIPLCREHLEKYKQVYENKLEQEKFPLSSDSITELKGLEKKLGLSDFNFLHREVEAIEKKLSEPLYRTNFEQYKQQYRHKLEQDKLKLSSESMVELSKIQRDLGLKLFCFEDLNVKKIEKELLKVVYQANLQKYKQEYKRKLYQNGITLSPDNITELKKFRNDLGLDSLNLKSLGLQDADVINIEKLAKDLFYQESLQCYAQELRREIESKGYATATDYSNNLKKAQQSLGIRGEDIRVVEGLVKNNWTIEHLIINCESGINYWKLMELLAKHEWQKADILTRDIILKLANRKDKGNLDKEAIEKFPAKDIYTLDRLWVEYSKGHFGFSVQKKIFDSVNRKEQQFAEKVKWKGNVPLVSRLAWKSYNEMVFSLNAPKGHLPIWAAKDKKIFTDDFLHLKVWDFKDDNLNSEQFTNIISHQAHYSEEAFWEKLRKFAARAGKEVTEKVLTLFYAAQQPNVPLAVKAAMLGAIGYFILPLDLVSDFIPVVGWTDDLAALGAALASAAAHITPEVTAQVKKKMGEIFGK
ncbi:DUF1232 domain-containing protein [Komarekiella sp. 'clone 1']|uniref:DUF1232 domain-containing protein n=1 Tax=Komarekiella delphini-convector SJRDD-AB1 TaxID=2593771 RepID=A0AA40SUV3_9NOST|nr:GUN4 domain-containing protein [Komarekiella delphini-convector]MBD6615698.1 DUF1232 domain-containing protein [Komarekiella delphini-convector SJRDD-AB1]